MPPLTLQLVNCTRKSCFVGLHPRDRTKLGAHSHSVFKVGAGPYLAWAGDLALEQGTVEISSELVQSLGLTSPLDLEYVPSQPPQSRASVRVLSDRDWSLISSHASVLESTILSQVGVLSQGCTYPLWVGAGVVYVKVEGLDQSYVLLREDCDLHVLPPEGAVPAPVQEGRVLRVIPIITPDCDMVLHPLEHAALGVEGVVKLWARSDKYITLSCGISSKLVGEGALGLSPQLMELYGLYQSQGVRVEAYHGCPIFTNTIVLVHEGPEPLGLFSSHLRSRGVVVLVQGQVVCLGGAGVRVEFPGAGPSAVICITAAALDEGAVEVKCSRGRVPRLHPLEGVVPNYLLSSLRLVATFKTSPRIPSHQGLCRSPPLVVTGPRGRLTYLLDVLADSHPVCLVLDCGLLLGVVKAADLGPLLKGSAGWSHSTGVPLVLRDLDTLLSLPDIGSKCLGLLLREGHMTWEGRCATAHADSPSLARLFVNHVAIPAPSPRDRVVLGLTEPDSGPLPLINLGALDQQVEQLCEAILLPVKYPLLSRGLLPRGALVTGPSGTGKTLLVEGVVQHCALPLRVVHGPELLSKYIGQSERGVRDVFDWARAAAPSVVLFDEVEALCPRRGADSTGVTDRVVNQMLCYLDGVGGAGAGVFVIAVTSRPDLLDPALTRPGRLDLHVSCDLLRTAAELKAVVEAVCRSLDITVPDGVDEELLQALPVTGADVYSHLSDIVGGGVLSDGTVVNPPPHCEQLVSIVPAPRVALR